MVNTPSLTWFIYRDALKSGESYRINHIWSLMNGGEKMEWIAREVRGEKW